MPWSGVIGQKWELREGEHRCSVATDRSVTSQGWTLDQTGKRTWSGIPLQIFYTGTTPAADYSEKLGNPGEAPFARGPHPEMYRGRPWITRQLCGLSSPAATNGRLQYLIQNGQTGLAIVPDTPTQLGIDSDHPLGRRCVGTQGVPLCTVNDMERMLEGIDLSSVTASFSVPGISAPVLLAQFLAVADKTGVPWQQLRGSFQNDPLQAAHTSYDVGTPLRMAMRLSTDMMEFCARNVPRFHSTTVNAYDLRESGLNAWEEIGVAIAMAMAYIQGAVDRGITADEVAPGILLICSANIDLFEEVAKFRAARRIWAGIMRERFGAESAKAQRLTLAVHTAGSSLYAPQLANNIVRSTVEALAAILGGCQGLDLSAFDEPLDLPSEQAAMVALRTQQILALETGVANVADPLGGSWFVEELTNELEERALAVISEITSYGGMVAAIERGWLRELLDERQYAAQRLVETGERRIVGVNCYRIPEEDDTLLRASGRHADTCQEQVLAVEAHRRERNESATRVAMERLLDDARNSGKNLILPIKAAVEAGATLGEVIGTIREAYEAPFDPSRATASKSVAAQPTTPLDP